MLALEAPTDIIYLSTCLVLSLSRQNARSLGRWGFPGFIWENSYKGIKFN